MQILYRIATKQCLGCMMMLEDTWWHLMMPDLRHFDDLKWLSNSLSEPSKTLIPWAMSIIWMPRWIPTVSYGHDKQPQNNPWHVKITKWKVSKYQPINWDKRWLLIILLCLMVEITLRYSMQKKYFQFLFFSI